MKKAIKKMWNHIEGINGIIFILYTTFVFGTYAFTSKINSEIIFIVRSIFIILIIAVITCPSILKRTGKINIKQNTCLENKCDKKKLKILFFILPMIVFIINYIAYYPGGFSEDTINQYEQVINNQYNDWHPVLQTLFAIKLPLSITGGWIGSIVLFQIIIFSLALSYMAYSILIYTNKKYAILALAFILLNPTTGNIAMYPWKDVSFAIGALVLMTFVLRIYCTKGEWIKRSINTIAFIIVITVTTVFRHNAILFTIPLLIAVLFYITKKRGAVITLTFILLLAGIKGPLYTALDVEAPDSRQVETLGLPMTIIGAAVVNDPDSLDNETRDFAYKVASKEVWESKYSYGNFNYIKWEKNTNLEVIEEYGAGKVINMMFKCIISSPRTSLMGLIKLTDPVYTLSDDYCYNITPDISYNEYEINATGITALTNIIHYYSSVSILMLSYLFMIGSMHMILLIAILSKCKLNRLKDWKKILIIIPVFVYNFGSMLLLTNAYDSCRFFYYTFLLVPVLLVIMFRKENKNERSAEEIIREK